MKFYEINDGFIIEKDLNEKEFLASGNSILSEVYGFEFENAEELKAELEENGYTVNMLYTGKDRDEKVQELSRKFGKMLLP